MAAFDLDFDHGFHHFFLEVAGRLRSVVGVMGVAAAEIRALLFLVKTRRADSGASLGCSFGGASCGNLREGMSGIRPKGWIDY